MYRPSANENPHQHPPNPHPPPVTFFITNPGPRSSCNANSKPATANHRFVPRVRQYYSDLTCHQCSARTPLTMISKLHNISTPNLPDHPENQPSRSPPLPCPILQPINSSAQTPNRSCQTHTYTRYLTYATNGSHSRRRFPAHQLECSNPVLVHPSVLTYTQGPLYKRSSAPQSCHPSCIHCHPLPPTATIGRHASAP